MISSRDCVAQFPFEFESSVVVSSFSPFAADVLELFDRQQAETSNTSLMCGERSSEYSQSLRYAPSLSTHLKAHRTSVSTADPIVRTVPYSITQDVHF
jgi:hypothetical protein